MPAKKPTHKAQVYGAMLAPAEAQGRLRDRGARMTAQRHAVLEVLSGNRTHPTAEAIVADVRERLGCVAPATIYNTLDALADLGFVRRIDGLEQKARFDPDTSAHEHAICLKCKTVWDVEPVAMPAGLPEDLTVVHILIQGICGRCARSSDNTQGED